MNCESCEVPVINFKEKQNGFSLNTPVHLNLKQGVVIKHLPFSPLVLKVNDKMFSLHFIMHDKFPYYRAAKFQLSCLPLFFHFSRNLRYLSLL